MKEKLACEIYELIYSLYSLLLASCLTFDSN